jgi:Tol biopolymer transport system component
LALTVGTRLGPYEILGPLGAGGMGEVYKARDTRLDRSVAIKVLPPHLADSAPLRQRLEREAKAISSLSHPHICALHDIGHQDGTDYLVMEYLEGQTLAQRLEKGPFPQEEALSLATQIADALHQAHKQGVIHRDLKPGNIMLTTSGAKLLDFGLAKSTAEPSPAGDMTAAPTMTSPLTVEGTVVGTFQYMAPEQLEGAEASTRSDIFAFGVVLYEILTGVKPFTGKTQASLVAAILKESPTPLSQSLPAVNPALEQMVTTCLEKDPDQRRQSMHDVLLELRWLQTAGSEAGVPAPARAQRKSRERTAWLVAAVAIVAATLIGIALFLQPSPEIATPLHVNIALPEGTRPSTTSGAMALSPDGKSLAFVAKGEDGGRHFWVRRLDQPSAQRVDNSLHAEFPFWSPDSRHLAFFVNSTLKRLPVSGGTVDTICEFAHLTTSGGRGGAWSQDGTIIFNAGWGSPLHRVSAAGGAIEPLTELATARAETHRHPSFLPDGKRYLFSIRSGADENVIALGNPDGSFRTILAADSNATFISPSYLLYWRESALRARPFDPDTEEFTGDPFMVAAGVALDPADGAAMFSASPTGTLAYLAGNTGVEHSRLLQVDREGNELAQVGPPGNFYAPRLSPDGTRAAVDNSGIANNGDIWLYEMDHPAGTRLTTDPTDESSPVFSPDGRKLVFLTHKRGPIDIHLLDLGRGGAPTPLIEAPTDDDPTEWSPDGRYLLLTREPRRNQRQGDIVVYDFESGEVTDLVATSFHEHTAQFSPDGNWIVYASNESGMDEVYMRPFPEGSLRRQISVGGGSYPRWSQTTDEIFYVDDHEQIVAVSVITEPELKIGRPTRLFDANLRFGISGHFDPLPDAQSFLVNQQVQSDRSRSYSLILNWNPADTQRQAR